MQLVVCFLDQLVDVLVNVKDIAIGPWDLGFDTLGRSNRTQSRQPSAIAAMFLRSCVAQALSCGDGPRHCFHDLAQHREYNENLIFFVPKLVECFANLVTL